MDKKIIVYVILIVLALGLVVLTFFPGIIHALKDSGISGNSVEDKCSPPPGQSEEAWREHMGHHPDIYRECLT